MTLGALNRIALIGSKLAEDWGFHQKNRSGWKVDFLPIDEFMGTPRSKEILAAYDLVLIQFPLRSVISSTTLKLLSGSNTLTCEDEFRRACEGIERQLFHLTDWDPEVRFVTFVANFVSLQIRKHDPLSIRFNICNPEYFAKRLNEYLERVVRLNNVNAYVLDLHGLSEYIGLRHIQYDVANDSVIQTRNDASLNSGRPSERQDGDETANTNQFSDLVWKSTLAMYEEACQLK
jgi:hypothetical protein